VHTHHCCAYYQSLQTARLCSKPACFDFSSSNFGVLGVHGSHSEHHWRCSYVIF
jgi:hypothetical protein